MVRVFDAPRAEVWKEWTEASRFADWFGGSEVEVPASTVSIDLRVGGVWTATTLAFGPERRDICWQGRYLEVVPPERLTFTIIGLLEEQPPDIVTVSLEDLGDGRTEMSFIQAGRRTVEQYETAQAQWSMEFDSIAQRLLVNAQQAGRRR